MQFWYVTLYAECDRTATSDVSGNVDGYDDGLYYSQHPNLRYVPVIV
jgi:hypothetical protein